MNAKNVVAQTTINTMSYNGKLSFFLYRQSQMTCSRDTQCALTMGIAVLSAIFFVIACRV